MKKIQKSEILNKKILFNNRINYDSLNNTTYLTNINNDILKKRTNLIPYFIKTYDNKEYSNNSKLSKYSSNLKHFSFNKKLNKPKIQKIMLKNIKSIVDTSDDDNKNKNSTSLDYHKISYSNENNLINIKNSFPYPDKKEFFSKIPLTPIKYEKNINIFSDELKKKISNFYNNKKAKLKIEKLNILNKEMIDNIEKDLNMKKHKSNSENENMRPKIISETNSLSKNKLKNCIKEKMQLSLNCTVKSYLLNKSNNKNNKEILNKDRNFNNNIFNNLEIKKYVNNQIFPDIYHKGQNNYKSVIISKNKNNKSGTNNYIGDNNRILNNYSFLNQKFKIQSLISRNKYNSFYEEDKKINNNKFEDKCVDTNDEI